MNKHRIIYRVSNSIIPNAILYCIFKYIIINCGLIVLKSIELLVYGSILYLIGTVIIPTPGVISLI